MCDIRRLALPYYSWRKTRTGGDLKLLLQFRALREVWITFLGSYESGGRDWVEVLDVGDLDLVGGHLGEAEVEIRRDVEELKRECPRWGENVSIGFVKHKGSLAEILES